MPRRRSSRRNEGTFDYNFDEVVGQILLAKTGEALSGGGRVDGRGPSAWHHTPPRETSRLRVNGSSRTRRTPRRAVDHPGLAHRTGAALAQATPRGRNNLRPSPSRISVGRSAGRHGHRTPRPPPGHPGQVAEEELAHMAELCNDHNPNTLLTVVRELTDAGVKEGFRMIESQDAGLNQFAIHGSLDDDGPAGHGHSH